MKYISKELGTQKQYQELLACLDENSPCNPRDTAETMLKIVCNYRIRNSAYSDNLELCKLVAAFAERHIADEEILWRCVRIMCELGSLSDKKRSKKYCYQFLWRFRSHSNKRVRCIISTTCCLPNPIGLIMPFPPSPSHPPTIPTTHFHYF